MTTKGCNKIYKYQPFNLHSLDNIWNSQIWFSNPMQLNDPLEGKAPFHLIEPDDNEWKEIHERFMTNKYPSLLHIKRVKNSMPDDDQKRLIKMIANSKLVDLIYQKKNIACFSSVFNIFLMWSHYADGHRGFCLEFDRSIEPFSRAENIFYTREFLGYEIDQVLSGNIKDPNKAMKSKVHW